MRRFVVLAGWFAAAVLTTTLSIWAVSLLGQGITTRGAQPLSRSEVERALAESARSSGPSGTSTPGARPTATRPPRTAPAGEPLGLSSPGGSVTARCDAGLVTLLQWAPAQGFRTDDVAEGPATGASVKFEADHGRKVFVDVTCRSGTPIASISTKGDDRGRGGD